MKRVKPIRNALQHIMNMNQKLNRKKKLTIILMGLELENANLKTSLEIKLQG